MATSCHPDFLSKVTFLQWSKRTRIF
uniref:Uncharacterized protein n=1 Tax=Arundo donax TaxID=35708 RepID=A0A0A8YMK2_ARUDO